MFESQLNLASGEGFRNRETRGRIPSQHIKHYLRSKEYGGLSGNNPWGEGNNTSNTDKTATYEEKQYFFHPDHLGSSNYLTDVLGEAYQHIEYLPWGEVFVEERNTQTSRNTFLYTGKELDEMTGLYYYEQRYYDPDKSTFLGVDQLTDKYSHISGFAYVANNPMIFVDPDGRDWYINESTGELHWNKEQYENNDIPEGYTYLGDDLFFGEKSLEDINKKKSSAKKSGKELENFDLDNKESVFYADKYGFKLVPTKLKISDEITIVGQSTLSKRGPSVKTFALTYRSWNAESMTYVENSATPKIDDMKQKIVINDSYSQTIDKTIYYKWDRVNFLKGFWRNLTFVPMSNPVEKIIYEEPYKLKDGNLSNQYKKMR